MSASEKAATDPDRLHPRVDVFPKIVRDSAGHVERRRTIAIVDVFPSGDDYEMTVSVEDIPASGIEQSRAIRSQPIRSPELLAPKR